MANNLQVDEGTGGKYAETTDLGSNVHRPGVEVKNPSIAGTAGSPNAGVLSVQGLASMYPVIMQGQQSARNTGNFTANSQTLGPWACSSYNIATVTISGTYNSVTTIFEGSDDGGTTWFAIQGVRTDSFTAETGGTLLTNTTRAWDIPIGAFTHFRVRDTAWTSGTAVIGCTFQSMPYEPSPTTGAVFTAPNGVQWVTYSQEYTTAQTSADLVAASGSTKIYVGAILLSTGYVASATTLTAKVYFGTGAYSAGTSKIVAAGEFSTIPGTGLVAYPGLVRGDGQVAFAISAAGDALKLTTAATTHPRLYLSVGYIQV